MFDASDPRRSLGTQSGEAEKLAGYGDAECIKFYEELGVEEAKGCHSWFVRGQNFVVAWSELQCDSVLRQSVCVDEWMLLVPDKNTVVGICLFDESHEVVGNSLAIVPATNCEIKAIKPGRVIRVFTCNETELIHFAINQESYEKGSHPNVTRLGKGARRRDPSGLRIYDLDVEREEGRFGRIWRSSNLMINVLYPEDEPRDPSKLSPHWHPDFEQCTIVLTGEYIHHLRWPWTTRLEDWRDDAHLKCLAGSVIVIPPGVIHTSQGVGTERNQLIDIFAPPRRDFVAQPGWVLNSDEYVDVE